MDISGSNIAGKCTNKCIFSFKYPTTSATATNYGNQITIHLSNPSSVPDVKFNTTKYSVASCQICCPSVHKYNGNRTDAELLIIHRPINGGKMLFVWIPISLQGINTTATKIISDIILAVSNGAPSQGQNTNKISEFTLDNVVPSKPFYNYSTMDTENIVFDINNAIGIQKMVFDKLKNVISPPMNSVNAGPELFINTNGPSNVSSNDIYIDCQPTDSSGETVKASSSSSSSSSSDSTNDLMTSPPFIIIVSLLLFLIVVYAIYKAIEHLNMPATKASM
jgi:carbonic anhydrase